MSGALKLTVIGAGYVGLTTGVPMGYLLTAIDQKESIIESLLASKPRLHEPGLGGLFAEVRRRMRSDVEARRRGRMWC